MSDYIGSRISLISKSDIRYVGTLASINSDDSTVSLENVRTFGTEGRKGKLEEEVPPSDQVYEYIVFRGTDVKDLRIEEGPAAKENKPPAVPNDPAIVGARPRPSNVAPGPPGGPQGPPQGPGPIGHPGPHGAPNQQQPPPGAPGYGYFPPHMGGWAGRPGPGGPGGPSPGPVGPGGPGPFGMPYPQPGWFPPGQEFPPMGPGQWNPYPQFPPGPGGPGGPGGPPGFPAAPGAPGQGRQSANQTPSNQGPSQKPAPIGPSGERKPVTPGHNAQSSESKPMIPPPQQSAGGSAPPPPVASKPTAEEVKATAANLAQPAAPASSQESRGIPTGPKNDRPVQILPAIPLPVGLTSRVAQPSPSATRSAEQNNAGATPAALRDATQAAKEAVANAMAQMENNAFAQIASQGAAVDNLTKKVNEMRVNAARGGNTGRGGRGRGGARPAAKVEVPDSDYDFATANAKFNKQDLVREAIAGGSPIVEAPAAEIFAPEAPVESTEAVEPAYNKQRSFFDNISSDLKDRENSTQKPGGREWRGEEQRKNIETFGQGSVDGGYRGYRGGRGRGRGGRGRGFRGGRGGNNGYRPRDPQQQQTQPPQ
ncbi:Scd6-like Sm domain-containing protein [Triangularia setosa]|uniref:Scd6-like Sm domain-containing protein n=1 Tax=Triangularia setosa TaxID=2587417 RepID=A0AAN6WCW9_9PEZI|nr:Scd6-like Sm domain-containing protein [Podospora setosa]